MRNRLESKNKSDKLYNKENQGMYTGFKVNTSINKSIISGRSETQVENLQKEVDTYTRKL